MAALAELYMETPDSTGNEDILNVEEGKIIIKVLHIFLWKKKERRPLKDK